MLRSVCVLLLALLLLFLTACAPGIRGGGTRLEFSYNEASPVDAVDTKRIYINQGVDSITLNATLELNAGEVMIQVTDTDSGSVAWKNLYTQSARFTIELDHLEPDTEYELVVNSWQIERMSLKLTSDNKLVKDREPPERSLPAKPDRG